MRGAAKRPVSGTWRHWWVGVSAVEEHAHMGQFIADMDWCEGVTMHQRRVAPDKRATQATQLHTNSFMHIQHTTHKAQNIRDPSRFEEN